MDEAFPFAWKIILVIDNLNTQSIASVYETFPAEEAKRLKDKLEIPYTLKYGSWLNMAEIELKVINNQGVATGIAIIQQMREETA